jgi:hypothetical protein
MTVLLALLALGGAVAYPLTSTYYASAQSPSAYGPLSLLLLALVEAYTAYTTRARLAGRPGTRPIHPLTVARVAVLAKATSPVAALATGAYAGFVAYVVQIEGPDVSHDLRTGVAGLVCSLALGVTALLLERVCRVQPPTDDNGDEEA